MIIDSHCHLDFDDFDNDRNKVLQRAKNKHIEKLIVAGISQTTWPRLKSICQQNKNLYPCYGLHPYFINQHKQQHLDDLQHWLENNFSVAIGGCGLDFYLQDLDKIKQQHFFEAQLDLALQFNLPVVIHSRKANTAVLKAIKNRSDLRGMVHSFSGSIEVARQFIELGFYISLGAIVTFEKATKIRKMACQLPLKNLLVESDAPDQPGLKHFKQRNEPAYIVETIKVLSALRNEAEAEIIEASSHNAIELFGI